MNNTEDTGQLKCNYTKGALLDPNSNEDVKQWLYRVHTVTVGSHYERRFWTKSLVLSENECVLV